MAEAKEIKRLKDSNHKLREQILRLISLGEDYSSGFDCIFCSGMDGYESATDNDDNEIVHSPECEAVKAHKLINERLI